MDALASAEFTVGFQNHMLLIFDKLMIPLFIVAAIALISFIVNFIRCYITSISKKSFNEMPILPLAFSIILVVFPIICVFILDLIMGGLARQEVNSFLNNIEDEYSIKINDTIVKKPYIYLKELKKITVITTNHTSPIGKFKVEVKDNNGILNLILGQDSKHKDEYWVFYPKYRFTN